MTVAELIEALKEVDPETRLFTSGYEGGYCDVHPSEVKDMILNVNSQWYLGPHQRLDCHYGIVEGYSIVKGIIL